MDFEAVAAKCRSAAFRESLTASPVWTQAAEAIQACSEQLQTDIRSASALENAGDDKKDGADDQDDDGLGYTFRVDRKNPTAESLRDDFSPPKPEVHDMGRVSENIGVVTSVFRFLRNACAASTDNQDDCQEAGLLKKVRKSG
ncbi:unnamed protein product [Phytophthora lilii]|uniref:Unnamed protein product n=1 Tax=Phytophthora lilii TaxID=2077276 RepID=A0A9W6TJW8_9STRA|nr:unnamed protein product [Phytophthora lilii]